MFRNLFYRVMRDELETFRSTIQRMVVSHVPDVLKMDYKAQYLIVVQDDQTARDLVTQINDVFDQSNMPRIVVLSAKNVHVIEINKE